ncbi:hypothetical protein MMPV_001414 [Pyropia vietnamensis]
MPIRNPMHPIRSEHCRGPVIRDPLRPLGLRPPGEVLLKAVTIERLVDDAFAAQASKKSTIDAGWMNAAYCERWRGTPTPTDYLAWRSEQSGLAKLEESDPLVSYEYFAALPRVRPGILDSKAARRRVHYRGKDRHVADVEGDGDACNKAFSIKAGLTQGVFNVVCPHVITLGFRCLFRAESVGEALSIVLERFPKLPRVILYDVACKLDKNAMRRVRPIMRAHGVRFILDRPHSITHTCSPIYMPDDCLGATAGVATQAAEVSHSVAVANRTSLAYMSPATYMLHKMVQVAFMNVRKKFRLSCGNPPGESDHVWLAPFFHSNVSPRCARFATCSCGQTDQPPADYGEASPVAGIDDSEAGASAASDSDGSGSGAPREYSMAVEAVETADAEADKEVEALAVAATDEAAACMLAASVPAASGTVVACYDTVAAEAERTVTCDGERVNSDRGSNVVAVTDAVSADDVVVVDVVGTRACRIGDVERDKVSAAPVAPGLLDAASRAVDRNAAASFVVRQLSPDELCTVADKERQSSPLDSGNEALAGHAHWRLLLMYARSADRRSVVNPAPMDTRRPARRVLTLTRDLLALPLAEPVRPLNKARILLTGSDFRRLRGQNWLNDELINSFVALINHRDTALHTGVGLGDSRQLTPGGRAVPRTRVLSSFFFSRLAPRLARYEYGGVERWGRKQVPNLDAVDLIIVPVNLKEVHWVLVVIDAVDHLFYFYDSLTHTDRHGVIDVLRRWLGDEVRSRLDEDAAARWNVASWTVR